MSKKKRSVRDAAKKVVRTPSGGGRLNRNTAMGPRFAHDVKATIADQMRLDPTERLSVRALFVVIKEIYPLYPNHYSAFRVWAKDTLGYRGAATEDAEILFDLDEFPGDE